jgi:hypothetical protein
MGSETGAHSDSDGPPLDKPALQVNALRKVLSFSLTCVRVIDKVHKLLRDQRRRTESTGVIMQEWAGWKPIAHLQMTPAGESRTLQLQMKAQRWLLLIL